MFLFSIQHVVKAYERTFSIRYSRAKGRHPSLRFVHGAGHRGALLVQLAKQPVDPASGLPLPRCAHQFRA